LVIVSGFLKQIKESYFSARIYAREFAISYGIFFLMFVFYSAYNYWLSALALFVLIFVQIMFIGKRRNTEIRTITSIIRKIRKNEISSSDEIKLDIELKGLEDEIKKMVRRSQQDFENLQKLANSRRDFLANVSHELRTPIFAIQGFLETVLDGKVEDPAMRQNFLQKALNRTEGLNVLLNDLINISLIESGTMKLEFISFNLFELLIEIFGEFETSAQKKGIVLILNKNPENINVCADRKRIRQVLSNIVQNAIRYTDKGKVEILTEILQDEIKISVKDTGIGIPPEDIDRIFERFYRVDKARSRKIGGTGLGLAITKHILEAHGSKISVKSLLDKGSEFSFSLKSNKKSYS